MIKQLVHHVVTQLVEKPGDVSIEVFHDTNKTMVEIKVAEDDFKRVVGKDGRVIKTIRSMVQAIYATPEKELLVDIAK